MGNNLILMKCFVGLRAGEAVNKNRLIVLKLISLIFLSSEKDIEAMR